MSTSRWRPAVGTADAPIEQCKECSQATPAPRYSQTPKHRQFRPKVVDGDGGGTRDDLASLACAVTDDGDALIRDRIAAANMLHRLRAGLAVSADDVDRLLLVRAQRRRLGADLTQRYG